MNYGRVLDAKRELEKLGPQPDDVLDAFDISTYLPFASSALTFASFDSLLPSLHIQSHYLDRESPIELTGQNLLRNKRDTNLLPGFSSY